MKQLTGIVTSDKMDKTVTVEISRVSLHPLYNKRFKRTKSYLAHNEKPQAKQGDKVVISESRPMSARKRWTVTKIVEKAS